MTDKAVETTTDATPMVSVRGVHKFFGDLHVLRGIDLDIAPGEVCVILGPSGSGKSTLLRCLNLLEKIERGSRVRRMGSCWAIASMRAARSSSATTRRSPRSVPASAWCFSASTCSPT